MCIFRWKKSQINYFIHFELNQIQFETAQKYKIMQNVNIVRPGSDGNCLNICQTKRKKIAFAANGAHCAADGSRVVRREAYAIQTYKHKR